MTTTLHIPARPDAPVACDMSFASDSPEERLQEYGRLFERAHSVAFAFHGGQEIRAWVDDLVRREAACCPFLDYRVESAGDDVVWTVSGRADDGSDIAAFLGLLSELQH